MSRSASDTGDKVSTGLGRDEAGGNLMLTHRILSVLLVLGSLLPQASAGAAPGSSPQAIQLGSSLAPLDGPWRFHTGDDPTWADPAFDDSGWESVDLTAPPGAHDPDVGLSGYVPGWSARGHAGYKGYAWYRLHLAVIAPAGSTLALAGPTLVDSAYQVFLDGKLLGGIGDFSGATPVVYTTQPRVFPLPQSLASLEASHVLAFRVWMGAELRLTPSTEAGGIHMAPALGESSSIEALCRLQWLQTFCGYIHEVVEALLFLLLAVMTGSLMTFDRLNRSSYLWLSAAMVLHALHRGNLAFAFWTHYETFQEFELFNFVLISPLYLGGWMLAWYSWFRLRDAVWIPKAVAVLTLLFVVARFLSGSWFDGVFHSLVTTGLQYFVTCIHLLFLLLLTLILYKGIRQQARETWFALPAVLAVSTGLFTAELSFLHIPGMWFPFGVGISRTDFAYLAFGPLMFAVLLRRLWSHARPMPTAAPTPIQIGAATAQVVD